MEKQKAIVPMIGGPDIDESYIRYHVVADLTRVSWGHHMLIIDKCYFQPEKALFYVRRTIRNRWSRDVLRNWLSTGLYEREGKAQTNFAHRVRILSSTIKSFANNS